MAVTPDLAIGKLKDMLVDVVKYNVSMISSVPKEINNLVTTLTDIKCFLEDTESKGVTKVIENQRQQLIGVLYDADVIFDLWNLKIDQETAAPATVCPLHLFSFCLPLLSFCRNIALFHNIGNRFRKLNLKLEDISKNKDRYGSLAARTVSVDNGQSSGNSSLRESDIVGIEGDTQMLVKKLTEPNTTANTLVLAIIGIGGVGKTTLARNIFHHEEIKDVFELKMWVRVSRNRNRNDIALLENIIKEAGGNPETNDTRTRLECELASTIEGKRFLLVIDDVWDEGLWDRSLRSLLGAGAAGSRVIVTTRKNGVAGRILELIHTHNVNLMSHEDGWSLLCRKVVLGGGEDDIRYLKEVGLEIVKKCDGLPLAIVALGQILRLKDKMICAWKSVRDTVAWSVSGFPDTVRNGLYLSILDLPLEMKQRFLFLSIWPEDYDLEMDYIVGIWIAGGLVKAQGESLSLEMVGENYFKELISRSLLQPFFNNGTDLTSRMHDLLRLLAQFLTQNESLVVTEKDQMFSPQLKLRHLAIVSRNGTTHDEFLKKQESLRTLLVGPYSLKHLNGIFSHLPLLRILDLSGSIPEGEELPDSLVSLVHLRFLDVSYTKITRLPDNLGNLSNLQFLLLRECSSLHGLPKSVVQLRNLRRLNLKDSKVEGVPVGIGRLENIHILEGFVAQSNNSGVWSSLAELQNLSYLMKLTIRNLEKVPDCNDARAAAIRKKSHLRRLFLSCSTSSSSSSLLIEEEVKRIEEIFNELQPPPCIEVLSIDGYPGSMSPTWISPSAPEIVFSNLKELRLHGWKNCEELPSLGRLPNLTDLYIEASSVKNIGPKFMDASCSGRAPISFPKLQKLEFRDMKNLKTWVWAQEVGALSCLQKLTMYGCLSLKAIPEGLQFHATSLTSLTLTRADSLNTIGNLAHLATLDVIRSASLTEISDLPSLKTLIVDRCPSLRVVKNLPALQTIRLSDLKMSSIPNWLAEGEDSANPSRLLEIHSTLDLMKKVCLGEEERPKIRHISHVNIYAEQRKWYATYTKTPCSFTTNINDRTTDTSHD